MGKRSKEVESIKWRGRIDRTVSRSANFDYAGPLTEAVLLGGVASRFPKTTLEWNAKKFAFGNVSEANAFVRRTYRKGGEVAGL